MTLHQLEYFCAVCRYHSITRAAAVLFVSQPTISMSIRELEKEFHLRLFNHNGNRLSLTQEGEAFYLKAENILRQSKDMYAEFSEIGNRNPTIKLGIPPMLSTVFFPQMLTCFHEQYDIPLQLFEYGSIRASELVESEDLDIALVNMDYYSIDHFNSHVMMEDYYVFCVSRTHHYAAEKEINFDMLRNEPIILFNTDSVQNHTILTGFTASGIKPNIIMHTSQLYSIMDFVRNGKCGAFMYSTISWDSNDFVKITLSPKIVNRFGIIWKKGGTLPRRTAKFIDFAKKYDVTSSIS